MFSGYNNTYQFEVPWVRSSELLVDVANKPFTEIMQEHVLKPLGMTASTFEQPLPQDRRDEAAVGHSVRKSLETKWGIVVEMARAGLWTTPTDLARFTLNIMLTYNGEFDGMLSREMVNQMLTPQIGGMGLGINVQGEGRDLFFFHAGSLPGYRCYLVAYPERGLGAVIMANNDLAAEPLI